MSSITPAVVDHGDPVPSPPVRRFNRPLGRKPRVLIYTSLFPNSEQLVHGNFILERMRHLIPYIDMSVVAPIPYFPRLNVNEYWFRFARIPVTEQFGGFEVDHPRYVVVPRIGMMTHGMSMFAGSLRQVRRRLKAADYDLIDAHYVYPDGFAATMLGALFNKPVVVSARGSDINLFRQFGTIRPMLQHVLRRASKVVAVTQALKNVMVGLGCPAEKIVVIGNGVDAVKFRPLPRSAARVRLGLAEQRPIVLSVGNLNENKGFQILVDAMALLRLRRPDLLLVIVGDGLYRTQLEDQIRNLELESNVTLAGAVAHEELSSWYSAADVFCLASLLEGCPNVILEAMACGCPVVATRAGGIPEMVVSPALGILVERAPNAFEAAITRALDCDWDRAAIADHAHAQSWDKVTAQLLKIYSEVLSKGSARAAL